MFININKKNSFTKSGLKVGNYESVVTSIDYHPDYADDSALQVRYELTNSVGEKFPFKETFLNNFRNERTKAFFEYLEENGIAIDALEDFCGCKEKVVLKKNATDRGTFFKIDEREFVSSAIGSVVSENELASSESSHDS